MKDGDYDMKKNTHNIYVYDLQIDKKIILK